MMMPAENMSRKQIRTRIDSLHAYTMMPAWTNRAETNPVDKLAELYDELDNRGRRSRTKAEDKPRMFDVMGNLADDVFPRRTSGVNWL